MMALMACPPHSGAPDDFASVARSILCGLPLRVLAQRRRKCEQARHVSPKRRCGSAAMGAGTGAGRMSGDGAAGGPLNSADTGDERERRLAALRGLAQREPAPAAPASTPA